MNNVLPYAVGQQREHSCPECKKKTAQEVVLFNPDDPDRTHRVWKCLICQEVIDIAT